MKLFRVLGAASVCLALATAGAVRAETKVELKGVHLCCGMCVKAVGEVLKGVDGVTDPKCDQKAGTVAFTAKDAPTAQKALDALVAAGFTGDTGNKDLAPKPTADVPKGKVKSLTISGVHNCCGMCAGKLKAVVAKVDGVKENTIKAKEDSFEVSGDFSAEELVKALTAAGFAVKVKK
jgi:copper chaperone CopZ